MQWCKDITSYGREGSYPQMQSNSGQIYTAHFTQYMHLVDGIASKLRDEKLEGELPVNVTIKKSSNAFTDRIHDLPDTVRLGLRACPEESKSHRTDPKDCNCPKHSINYLNLYARISWQDEDTMLESRFQSDIGNTQQAELHIEFSKEDHSRTSRLPPTMARASDASLRASSQVQLASYPGSITFPGSECCKPHSCRIDVFSRQQVWRSPQDEEGREDTEESERTEDTEDAEQGLGVGLESEPEACCGSEFAAKRI